MRRAQSQVMNLCFRPSTFSTLFSLVANLLLHLVIRRWAELVYEDIYLCVYKTDGFPSAMTLRSRINERMGRGSALDIFHQDMQNSQMNFFGTHHNSGGDDDDDDGSTAANGV